MNFLQNRFHIEHGFLSYAKVAFLKVIAKFILSFFCIVHELDILYINRWHHYNKKEKMELFFCIVFDLHYLCRRKAALGNLKTSFHCARLHYLCRRKSGTRQFENKFSMRSFALSLYKISCTSTMQNQTGLFCIVFGLHYLCKR